MYVHVINPAKTPVTELKRLKKLVSQAPIPASPIATARLQKLKLEIKRLKLECENARLDSEIRKDNLIPVDDAVMLIQTALETVTSWLRNMPDRFASRCNPEHFEVGLRGLEAARAELSVLVREAIDRVALERT